MGSNTRIEWCDATFNPWRGCSRVSEGCRFCYADTMSKRSPKTLGIWGPNGTRVVASEAMWGEPVKWNETPMLRCADCGNLLHGERVKGGDFSGRSWDFECHGCYGSRYEIVRPRVFCASLADVFEDWQGECLDSAGCAHYTHDDDPRKMVCNRQMIGCDTDGYHYTTLNDVRRRLFALIDATQNLGWLLLTKRVENIRRMWPYAKSVNGLCPSCKSREGVHGGCSCMLLKASEVQFRPNVWLGTSIATQADAERNLDELGKCEDLSPVRFVSAEPLLEHIDLSRWLAIEVGRDGQWRKRSKFGEKPMIDWLIVGGESGPHARPMHPDWVRSLRDQCAAAEVPFLMKQWGEWVEASQVEGGVDCMAKIQAIHPSGTLYKNSDTVPHGEGVAVIHRVGKKAAGRTLDGVIHDGYPKVTA